MRLIPGQWLVAAGAPAGGFVHIRFSSALVALRLVGVDKYVEGWIDRKVVSPFPVEVNNSTARGDVAGAPVIANYPHSNWERLQGGRGTLLIQPSDSFSLTFGAMHQKCKTHRSGARTSTQGLTRNRRAPVKTSISASP